MKKGYENKMVTQAENKITTKNNSKQQREVRLLLAKKTQKFQNSIEKMEGILEDLEIIAGQIYDEIMSGWEYEE